MFWGLHWLLGKYEKSKVTHNSKDMINSKWEEYVDHFFQKFKANAHQSALRKTAPLSKNIRNHCKFHSKERSPTNAPHNSTLLSKRNKRTELRIDRNLLTKNKYTFNEFEGRRRWDKRETDS